MTVVALATCEPRQEGWQDDLFVAAGLEEFGIEVRFEAWDDPAVEWSSFDRVVIRSTWDYFPRLEEFLDWAGRVGEERLRNRPPVIAWNADKRYLAELAGSGLPVPPTMLLGPETPVPEFGEEVVIKPLVGGGARQVGRFGPDGREAMLRLLAKIWEVGGTAMAQPYLEGIEGAGETGIVMIAGEFSHALCKRAFLEPDRPAGESLDRVVDAAVVPGLVEVVDPPEREVALAGKVLAWLTARFGQVPLLARIDTAPGPSGDPLLIEVELVEPCLYLREASEADLRPGHSLAKAIASEIGGTAPTGISSGPA